MATSTATDRFRAKVDRIMEAEFAQAKAGEPIRPGMFNSARARAVSAAVAEDPVLHNEYLAEFQAEQQAKRFRRE